MPEDIKYEIIREVENNTTEKGSQKSTLVRLGRPHVVANFEKEDFVVVDIVLIESGWVDLSAISEGTYSKFECTRVVASCESGHDHSLVLYQAPRQMDLWEALFSIGETAGPQVVSE